MGINKASEGARLRGLCLLALRERAKSMTKTILKIDGMMCGMCEAHINDAIRAAFPVKKVTSSHKKGETVVISVQPLNEKKLEEVVTKTGYTLKGTATEDGEEKKGLFGFLKK